jgi:predicted nuclease of predicted toxin-antitoxin system
LSLSLIVDEDTQANRLVEMLRSQGHDVLTVNEAGISGLPDVVVMETARTQQRVVLTRNCNDFLELHEANPEHSGILAIYQNNDFTKSMSYAAIVKAMLRSSRYANANLEETGLLLKGQFIVLNQYNW